MSFSTWSPARGRCFLTRLESTVAAPEDKPYDERAAGVKDSFGNIWWISTYKRSGNA
ncbi:hypothetical protein WMF04_03710 [Sorangium sp. So ce260]|uniref:hypothetical protein n=1 Tax=Sorangium sp. So ce260 TaxID=3133291 RepID=UPI003F642491